MVGDAAVLSALIVGNELVRRVFHKIVEGRRVRFRALLEELESGDNQEIAPTELLNALEVLKSQELVAELESSPSSRDFKTYYVTTTGLSAERKLRSVGLGL